CAASETPGTDRASAAEPADARRSNARCRCWAHKSKDAPLLRLPDLDLGVGRERIRRDREILRRRAFADASGRVVLRAVAGTEPTAILALVVAYRLPFGDAAEMRADADHHQPRFAVFGGAVVVGRRCGLREIGVARERIGQIVERGVLRLGNFLVGAVPDEDRLAAPHHGDGLPRLRSEEHTSE